MAISPNPNLHELNPSILNETKPYFTLIPHLSLNSQEPYTLEALALNPNLEEGHLLQFHLQSPKDLPRISLFFLYMKR